MTTIYLDTNSKFYDWCEQNGYDAEDEHDAEEELFKRGAHVSFYIPKESDGTFAQVTAYQSYDNGREDIQIQKEGLQRTIKETIITESVYE